MITISDVSASDNLLSLGMLKILNAEQIRGADAFTISNEPVHSIDLMERASLGFVDWLTTNYPARAKIGIICGTGNNGGDGLAIARLLKARGYPVHVWIVEGTSESADFVISRQRLDAVAIIPVIISAPPDEFEFKECALLVDAIFGSGLSRPPEGLFAAVIRRMNKTKAVRIAVDVPSGLFADQPSSGVLLLADQTVSFQLPKLAFMFPENGKAVGEWHLIDIQLSPAFIQAAASNNYYITREGIKTQLLPRHKFSNKGNFGKALLIAGSYGKMGACVLAARAALRSGLGLLTVHVPQTGYSIMQTAVPEAMVTVDDHEHIFTAAESPENYSVIGIGPGIGKADATREALGNVMKAGKPMVIDADALNIAGAHREMLKLIPAGSILTPHPKEFERVAGTWQNDFERLDLQRKLARDVNAVVVLKGAHTSIALPDGTVYFNSTGNPGMAKGGAGDVLTGILTGLLAQGYSAGAAAMIGVYLHGLSGDLAASQKGLNSLIASDLIDDLPDAFKKTEPKTQ